MKNKFLKIFLLVSLAALMAISLISCGNSSAANDASDGWGGISWDYKKDTKTLTITGAGSMPSAASSEEVSWVEVRESVEKVVFVAKEGEYITNIGDYAFYGMTNLKSISLPASVTSIGKCSFAFCSSLESVTIPSGVTSLGESAFEACVKLKEITLPQTVVKIGDRAFAFCTEMTEAAIAGNVEKIGAWTFKDCKKLTSLAMITGFNSFDGTAFDGAGISKITQEISFVTKIITNYKDSDGNLLQESKEEEKNYGESFSVVAPSTINGYTIKGTNVFNGTVNGEEKLTHTFTYEKIVETEAPAATDKPAESEKPADEKPSTTEIVFTVVLLVVVVIGIVALVILLVRSKKKAEKGTTVRKNDNKKK